LCAVAGWFSGWDVVMALVAMAWVAVMNGVSAGLRGAGCFAHDAAWQSWGRVVSAGAVAGVLAGFFGFGSVSSSDSLVAVFGAWAAGLALVALVGGWWWWRQGAVVVWPVAPVWAGWRVYQNDLGRVWPFAFMAAAGAWLLKGDVVVLAWWGGVQVDAVALSWYAACTRLMEAALLLFAPVANVLLRSFSDELLAGGALALRRRVARWCGWVGGLGLLGVALAWAVGPDWMALLFGAPYAEAGLLLPWVVAMLPFAWVNLVLGPWLAALGRERGLALGMLLAGAVLLLALWWWVPVWGLQGAAAAMVLSHAVLSAWGWWLGGRSA
jgi:O-antigen/teichoic acid export membrane protein